MVDYNDTNTIATPSNDINRIQILERRAYVIEALETYYRYKSSGASGNSIQFRTRLASLFWELEGTIKRKWGDYEEVKAKLFPDKSEPDIKFIMEVWGRINILLDSINLTKIDTKKDYDTTNLEEENSVQNV